MSENKENTIIVQNSMYYLYFKKPRFSIYLKAFADLN